MTARRSRKAKHLKFLEQQIINETKLEAQLADPLELEAQLADLSLELEAQLVALSLEPNHPEIIPVQEEDQKIHNEPNQVKEQAAQVEEQLLKTQEIEEQPVQNKEQPTQEQPTQEQATQEQPIQEPPTQEQPTQEQPTQEQPTQEQPTQEQPTRDQLVIEGKLMKTQEEPVETPHAQVEEPLVKTQEEHVQEELVKTQEEPGEKSHSQVEEKLVSHHREPSWNETIPASRPQRTKRRYVAKDETITALVIHPAENTNNERELFSFPKSVLIPEDTRSETAMISSIAKESSSYEGQNTKPAVDTLLTEPVLENETLSTVITQLPESWGTSSGAADPSNAITEDVTDQEIERKQVRFSTPIASTIPILNEEEDEEKKPPPSCEIALKEDVKIKLRINKTDLNSVDICHCAEKYLNFLQSAKPQSLVVFYDARLVRAKNAVSMASEIHEAFVPLRALLEEKLAMYAVCIPDSAGYKQVGTMLQTYLEKYPSSVPHCIYSSEPKCTQFLRDEQAKMKKNK